MRLDEWWTPVFPLEKYPNVSIIVKACLSIFTSPRVEQSFNIMNDIITTTTNRLDVSTFDSVQTVRYYLSSKETLSSSSGYRSTALNIMNRYDVRTDFVDSIICRHMQQAHKSNKAHSEKKKEEKSKEKDTWKINPAPAAVAHRKMISNQAKSKSDRKKHSSKTVEVKTGLKKMKHTHKQINTTRVKHQRNPSKSNLTPT